MRIILSAVCLAAVAAAGVFIRGSERTITSRRTALRAFDVHAREATDAFADIRGAQQAYVAAGQGLGFWMPKVDATTEVVSVALMTLRQMSTVEASRTPLEEAAGAFAEFGNIDKRIRGYLDSGSPLMAADIVFTEGVETAVKAARDVDRARTEEHVAADAFEAAQRKLEAYAASGAAALALLVVVALALMSGGPSAEPDIRGVRDTHESPARNHIAPPDADPSSSASAGNGDLLLREEGRADSKRPRAGAPDTPNTIAATALRTAAEVCTDLGRVTDPEQLRALLGRAAEALDASGLMVWMGTAAGTELRAVLAHGYSADMLARIPAVPRSANNAAATAFRTGTLQIMLSRPGSTKGAVVAPVLAADGCIGVLSAEIRDGGEASDTVQALAAIFAAHLAGVLAPAPAAADPRATAQV